MLLAFEGQGGNISIYLWHRSLMLVVGTASVMLIHSAKQAGMAIVINQSRIQ